MNRVVEFRTEELMKKAVEKVNKHVMNGRPLKVKEVSASCRWITLGNIDKILSFFGSITFLYNFSYFNSCHKNQKIIVFPAICNIIWILAN